MRNILIICLLICFSQQINAQVKYSNVNNFEIIKDKKKRKKLQKGWNRAVKGRIEKFDFVGESKSLIFLTTTGASAGYLEGLRGNSNYTTIYHHEAKYTNIDYMLNEGLITYYAFDKNSLELKFVNQLDAKMFSMSYPETIYSYIDYEKDKFHLFYRKREKGVIRYYHQSNNNSATHLKELDYILKKKTSINPPFPDIVAATSGGNFLIGITKDSKSYTNYIYTEEMKLKEKVKVELPVVATERPKGLVELGIYCRSSSSFNLSYNDQENTIRFVRESIKDKENQHIKIFEYDVKKEKLRKHSISLKKLGYEEQKKSKLLSSTIFYPIVGYYFQDDKFHVLGLNPVEDEGKYAKLATEAIYHQFDKNFNEVASNKVKVPNSIWEDLDKNQKNFKRKQLEHYLTIETNGNKAHIILSLIKIKAATTTVNHTTGSRETSGGGVESGGGIIFKVENDKIETPFIFTGASKKKDKFHYFYAGGQIYKMKVKKTFELYSLNNGEAKEVVSKSSNVKEVKKECIYGTSKYLLLSSKEVFVRITL